MAFGIPDANDLKDLAMAAEDHLKPVVAGIVENALGQVRGLLDEYEIKVTFVKKSEIVVTQPQTPHGPLGVPE